MEDSKSEIQKKDLKDKVTKVYQNYLKDTCKKTNWINQYCRNYLKKEFENGKEDITQQECLSASIRIVKHGGLIQIPDEWPPEPINGEVIDKLLQEGDDNTFITEITNVFWDFQSLACSFYPIEKLGNSHSVKKCSPNFDYKRLIEIYERLFKLDDEESGAVEKIFQSSISNIRDQLEKINNESYKYNTKALVRILMIWLYSERFYDPCYEEVICQINNFFYDLEEMKLWDRKEAEIFCSLLDSDHFLTMIKVNQQQLTFLMFDRPEENSEEMEKMRKYFLIIDFLFYSSRHTKKSKIAVREFHNDILNREWANELPDIYVDWFRERRRILEDVMDIDGMDQVYDLNKRKDKFLYMYFPWAFDASSKAKMMKYESQISQK